MAEMLRELADVASDFARQWEQVKALVTTNTGPDAIDDGREAEGISRLTLGDVQKLKTIVANINTEFDVVGNRKAIQKPTVRSLSRRGL